MGVNMRGKSLLTLLDYSKEDIKYFLELSRDFKRKKRAGVPHRYLEGKNVALIFEKTSTRTRCSFEVAGFDLGMGVTYLGPGTSQMGAKESISDTAKVLGRFYDGIEYRGFSQETVEILAKDSGVPVWNGLTDQFHPTQMLADLMTIEENFGRLEGLNFVFMGDGRNNVAHSLMIAHFEAYFDLNKVFFPASHGYDPLFCNISTQKIHLETACSRDSPYHISGKSQSLVTACHDFNPGKHSGL